MGQFRVQNVLAINSGNLIFQTPPPGGFTGAVAGSNGPTPGAILCNNWPGTDINFSELTAYGGLCQVTNLDPANYVTVGPHNGIDFFPVIELLPGESWTFRLSRDVGKDFPGTGTGSLGPTLRIVANTAACRVNVSAFDP